MEITYTLTPKDHLRHTRDFVSWRLKVHFPYYFTLALGISVFFSLLNPPAFKVNGEPSVWGSNLIRLCLQIPIGTLVVYVVLMFSIRAWHEGVTRREIRIAPAFSWGERHFSVSDGFATLRMEHFESRMALTAINRVIETPSATFLCIGPRVCFTLPTSAITAAALRAALKETAPSTAA